MGRFMDSVKEKSRKVKNWCVENKGLLISTLVVAGGTAALVISEKKAKQAKAELAEQIRKAEAEERAALPSKPEKVYMMKFFDEETGEPYSEEGIPCSEGYVKDYYE